jgi:hypothetical protein
MRCWRRWFIAKQHNDIDNDFDNDEPFVQRDAAN